MQQFVEKAGIPFYTTPQGRGVVPDDHPLSFLTMRSTAFKDADLIIVLGTRMNYIIGHAAPPRFNASAKIARIDIDADEIATARAQGRHRHRRRLQGGAEPAARRACKGKVEPGPLQGLAQEARRRRERRSARRPGANKSMNEDAESIRCGCARRCSNFMKRDAILVRRRPGDPELRPPVDADLRARASAELRPVRHDGRRPAVRRSAPSSPSPTSRSSACTATARSA